MTSLPLTRSWGLSVLFSITAGYLPLAFFFLSVLTFLAFCSSVSNRQFSFVTIMAYSVIILSHLASYLLFSQCIISNHILLIFNPFFLLQFHGHFSISIVSLPSSLPLNRMRSRFCYRCFVIIFNTNIDAGYSESPYFGGFPIKKCGKYLCSPQKNPPDVGFREERFYCIFIAKHKMVNQTNIYCKPQEDDR